MTKFYPSKVIVPLPEPGKTAVEEADEIKASLERIFPEWVFGVFLEKIRQDGSIEYGIEAAPRGALQ